MKELSEKYRAPFVATYEKFLAANGKVYVTFESGFEEGFHLLPGSSVVGGYSFSANLSGATLEFAPLIYRPSFPILETRIDIENGEENGLGIDCFSIHGDAKLPMFLEIFLFGIDNQHQFHLKDQGFANVTPHCLLCRLSAEYPDPIISDQSLLILNQPYVPMINKIFSLNREIRFFDRERSQQLIIRFLTDG